MIRWKGTAFFILFALVTGCQRQPTATESSSPVPQVAKVKEPDPAERTWTISNGSGEVVGKILAELPHAPANTLEVPDGLCADYPIEAQTKAGKRVEKQGWHVNEEIEQGGITFVSFFSQSTGGTSGNCDIHDGNVGIYEGDQLVADVYATKKSQQPIGRIAESNKSIRVIGSSVVGTPIADITVDRKTKSIVIKNIPDVETACNGSVKVPNIYDLKFTEARSKLQRHGWIPSDMTQEGEADGLVRAMWDAGYTEYSVCSGTGFGFCNLEYYNGRNGLTVTVWGEEGSTVSAYEVTCAK